VAQQVVAQLRHLCRIAGVVQQVGLLCAIHGEVVELLRIGGGRVVVIAVGALFRRFAPRLDLAVDELVISSAGAGEEHGAALALLEEEHARCGGGGGERAVSVNSHEGLPIELEGRDGGAAVSRQCVERRGDLRAESRGSE